MTPTRAEQERAVLECALRILNESRYWSNGKRNIDLLIEDMLASRGVACCDPPQQFVQTAIYVDDLPEGEKRELLEHVLRIYR